MTIAEKLTAIAENEPKVYASGMREANEKFWNDLTNNGERTDYQYAFREWGGEYFRPTRTIVPKTSGSANQTFHKAAKLKEITAGDLDFSQKQRGTSHASAYYFTFFTCPELERVGDIGMQADYSYDNTFSSCPKLRKVAKIRCDENTLFISAFHYCYALEEVFFEGVIGQNGLNFQWSKKLSRESIESIIHALSTTTGGLTLTLSATAVDKAFESYEGENNGQNTDGWYVLIKEVAPNWNIVLV